MHKWCAVVGYLFLVFGVWFGFWFLAGYAATQIALQLQQERIQVVRSNKVVHRIPTESNGTPTMDLGHMNVFCGVVYMYAGSEFRNWNYHYYYYYYYYVLFVFFLFVFGYKTRKSLLRLPF